VSTNKIDFYLALRQAVYRSINEGGGCLSQSTPFDTFDMLIK